MIGSTGSSSISRTTKSVGITRFPTFNGRSFRIPIGYLIDLSARTKEILVFLKLVRPNFLEIVRGIKLTLAPRSTRHLSKYKGSSRNRTNDSKNNGTPPIDSRIGSPDLAPDSNTYTPVDDPSRGNRSTRNAPGSHEQSNSRSTNARFEALATQGPRIEQANNEFSPGIQRNLFGEPSHAARPSGHEIQHPPNVSPFAGHLYGARGPTPIYGTPPFGRPAAETNFGGPSAYDVATAAPTARDYEFEKMRQELSDMSSRVHEAISAAPEIGRVLREAHIVPFTTYITRFYIPHPGKITFPNLLTTGMDTTTGLLGVFFSGMLRRFVDRRDKLPRTFCLLISVSPSAVKLHFFSFAFFKLPCALILLPIKTEYRSPVAFELVDAVTNARIVSGPLSSSRVEIVPLHGDFTEETWTVDGFKGNILKQHVEKRPLLTGDLIVTLKNDIGEITENVGFTDNSSWTRSGKFRLDAKLTRDGAMEAKSEPFGCKDRGKCK
ncbi:unnamed protein product [Cochlearia groenlandica]